MIKIAILCTLLVCGSICDETTACGGAASGSGTESAGYIDIRCSNDEELFCVENTAGDDSVCSELDCTNAASSTICVDEVGAT